jgi:hypothetical protein
MKVIEPDEMLLQRHWGILSQRGLCTSQTSKNNVCATRDVSDAQLPMKPSNTGHQDRGEP